MYKEELEIVTKLENRLRLLARVEVVLPQTDRTVRVDACGGGTRLRGAAKPRRFPEPWPDRLFPEAPAPGAIRGVWRRGGRHWRHGIDHSNAHNSQKEEQRVSQRNPRQ